MNSNIYKYIGKSGRYSPKMSEKRRAELKGMPPDRVKARSHADIWQSICTDWHNNAKNSQITH